MIAYEMLDKSADNVPCFFILSNLIRLSEHNITLKGFYYDSK